MCWHAIICSAGWLIPPSPARAHCRVKRHQQRYRKRSHLTYLELVSYKSKNLSKRQACAACFNCFVIVVTPIPMLGEMNSVQRQSASCLVPVYLCSVMHLAVHPADFADARLHRRIQSAEHIARLAESKVKALDNTACQGQVPVVCKQCSRGPKPSSHTVNASQLCWQAGDNSPRVPKLGSGLKLAPDDEDVCPTCLDPYSEGMSLALHRSCMHTMCTARPAAGTASACCSPFAMYVTSGHQSNGQHADTIPNLELCVVFGCPSYCLAIFRSPSDQGSQICQYIELMSLPGCCHRPCNACCVLQRTPRS